MNISATIELQFGGPGSGCHGENCGRPSEGGEQKEHGLHKMLKDVTEKTPAWDNLWGRLAKYGHAGSTEPFTKEEQATLRGLKKVMAEPCKIGFCFMNAQKLAMSSMHRGMKDIKYVEGLVTVHDVPLDHAWIELHGKVYDPTLMNEKGKMKGTTPKGEYFGVEVPIEEIPKHQLRTGHYSPLSHARENESLQRKIWK